jgi:hypothetical protein
MLKISAVYLIGKAEIPIHYTTWALVERALLMFSLVSRKFLAMRNITLYSVCTPHCHIMLLKIMYYKLSLILVKHGLKIEIGHF